ncbi:hypothetical protein DACRYDRAFT_20356 [Dacryopinax primogenitus]|uniref:Uncharacterized protein n=1 Tax=Dacryopinax primogenitus (strain DJM 731) TaxID=1858805 RepID=M5GDQ3_DACPD|nr:uncharacterized protein DACRYDRAFT_20356 [Dacryopinax primogenitus]EJU04712.1 hypothetical protein DACRYDRAFT_20356 [Dacryopinax primogenitus]
MLATAFLTIISLALLARSQIFTPSSAVQCEPVLVTWTATNSPPYIISVIPGGQVGAAAIENIGTFTSTSVTWSVDIPAGTSLTLQLRDGTGQPLYSAPFTVQTSSDATCIGTNAGYVGGAGLPAPHGSSSASAASSSGTTSGSASSGSSSSATTTTSASSAGTTTTSTSVASTSSSTSSSSHSSSSTGSISHTSSSTAATSASASPSSAAMAMAPLDFSMAAVAGLLGSLLFA